MHGLSFLHAQQALEKLLNVLVREKQDARTEAIAKRIAADFFSRQRARKQPVLIDTCGIEITGCELAIQEGRIGVKRWLTAFWPGDVNLVLRFEPGAIALGYVNGHQLYVMPPKSETEPAKLVARADMGPKFGTWCPSTQGMPQEDSVFFICLERARTLGYLPLFQRIEE